MSTWEDLWYGEESAARQVAFAPFWAASGLFGLGVAARNRLYDSGALPSTRVGPRVVSVGNITVGGSGKTPAVVWLAQRCLKAGRKVAVLSRGYGRADGRERRVTPDLPASLVGDEPLLIARRCPQAEVWVGPDRARLAQRVAGVDVVLLDDGFQHRQLERDADIVVIDEAVGFGNGRLLPRGPLREPVRSLSRASLIWLRASDVPRPLPPLGLPTVRARYAIGRVRTPAGEVVPASALKGRRLTLVAGVARPRRVAAALLALGVEVAGERYFPDHHLFRPSELVSRPGEELVTTEKDLMRLPPGLPAWVPLLDVEVLEGEAVLLGQLGLQADP